MRPKMKKVRGKWVARTTTTKHRFRRTRWIVTMSRHRLTLTQATKRTRRKKRKRRKSPPQAPPHASPPPQTRSVSKSERISKSHPKTMRPTNICNRNSNISRRWQRMSMMERWISTMTTRKTGRLRMKPSGSMLEKTMTNFNLTSMNLMSKKDSCSLPTCRKSTTRIQTLFRSQKRNSRS